MISIEPWGGSYAREEVWASSSRESLVPAHGSALGQRWSFSLIMVRPLSDKDHDSPLLKSRARTPALGGGHGLSIGRNARPTHVCKFSAG